MWSWGVSSTSTCETILVDESMHVDPERLQAIGRMGGAGYCTTRDRFEMPFGLQALDLPEALARVSRRL